jgi:hypothetical protein
VKCDAGPGPYSGQCVEIADGCGCRDGTEWCDKISFCADPGVCCEDNEWSCQNEDWTKPGIPPPSVHQVTQLMKWRRTTIQSPKVEAEEANER